MDKTGPDQQAIRHLTYLGTLTDQIHGMELNQVTVVHLARKHGASWRMIGVALGTSTQAAWERFSGHKDDKPISSQDVLFAADVLSDVSETEDQD